MTIISFQDANYPKPKPCIAKDNGVVGDDHGDDDDDDEDVEPPPLAPRGEEMQAPMVERRNPTAAESVPDTEERQSTNASLPLNVSSMAVSLFVDWVKEEESWRN